MPITTSISRSYAIKMIAVAILCAVFGVWGIYDYAIAIPNKQRAFDRYQVLNLSKTALESTNTTSGSLTPEAVKADEEINQEWLRVTGRLPKDTPANEVMALFNSHERGAWLKFLSDMKIILQASRTPPLDDPLEMPARKALEYIDSELGTIGVPTPPSAFDRMTQWFFIASLPCTPWVLWLFVKARRQKYRLDEDGTLHYFGDPEFGDGAWTRDEIADIDMHRWMAKSIAWAVHQDGRRLKLDAYLHKDLHLIIGAIASRMHPEEWDAEAKPVKKDLPPSGGTLASTPETSEAGVGT